MKDQEDQALFSSEDKSKKLKCRLLQFMFGASRVNLFDQCTLSSLILWMSHFLVLGVSGKHFHFTALSIEISISKQCRP